jgi:hypothetical protein
MGFEQLPGSMPLTFRAGDDIATEIDVSIPLVGYTVSSQIVSLVTGSIVQTVATSITSAANGIIGISLTDTETSVLPAGTYSWQLTWVAPGGVTRTALAGMVEVVK